MNEEHRIGKYDLIALIARGGMGDVYLARTGGLGGFHKLVVVKTLKPELAEDEKFRSMFLDEAKLAARLNHRNVVQTNDVGEADGTFFLIMEYLDGRSLAVIGKRAENVGEPLSLAFRVRVMAEMLAGLQHAHEAIGYDGERLGVVHRDVCPANVLVTFDGQVRIVDFGVAKTKNQAQETQAGTIKGRVAYMSPEHVSGRGLDHRADIFSTGIMLWEALTGQRFWGGRSEAELLGALVRGELPELPPDAPIPAALGDACRKALALRPEDRFDSAHDMRLALETWLATETDRDPLETWKPKIAGWFARERAHVAKLIEASTNSTRVVSELPMLEAALSASTLPASYSGSASRSRSRASGPSTLSSPVASIPPYVEARRSSSTALLVAGGLAAVAVIGVVIWKLAAPPAPAVSELASTPSAPAIASATLRIEVAPIQAQLFVDDIAVGNPFSRAFEAGSTHQIRALSEGFAPKTEQLRLAENTQIRLQLEALPTAAEPAAGRPAAFAGAARTGGGRTATAAQPSSAPPQPSTAKPTPRGVDSNNPYARPDTPAPPARTVDPANPYGNR